MTVIIGAVLAVFLVIAAIIIAENSTAWERIDSDGECYVQVHTVDNAFLTPGEDKITRTIYCKSELSQSSNDKLSSESRDYQNRLLGRKD